MYMNEERRPLTKESVIAEITFLIQQFNQTGAGFAEPRRMEEIIVELGQGKITPEEALAQARALDEGKEDYH